MLVFDLHFPGFMSCIVFVDYYSLLVTIIHYLVYTSESNEKKFMLLSHGWI